MSDKTEHSLQLKPRQWEFLQAMVKKYQMPDESKALRCLIDYALKTPSAEGTIFAEIRCLDC